ncbi:MULTISPECIES: tetratricopeptide repeat protein [Psychrobacillus]|uniref:Tetratricopeptide repeat protein n=1 Tax=Psychrobacillus faecigallinarum TaxID=2762235 RepID=A0ABR8R9C1_9BACI|nr:MULTISPECIES: tetratricopeptide repeat protein [Psychrobacillus]MBD7944400.1 tetratricopeptide repeat protein [Psychrobacillus faecigallinarum]QEY19685.1 helix-turn-helix domain-containing protein [Psychrobacillus sp. AK 1817]QGM30222.1 tetratricopeptide repeat protein [Bacillus sp. N3536]
MSSIGLIIKQERLNRNIKQTVLAKGICSTSYLSKIENNSTMPSKEVMEPLLDRLNLMLEEISQEEENNIINNLYELYKSSILTRDKERLKVCIQQYTARKVNFSMLKNFYSYNLYMFRLMLVVDEEVLQVYPYYQVLIKMEDDFDEKQKFLLNLNLGLYNYLIGEYYAALERLEQALKLLNNNSFEEWELADFHNAISLTYFKCNEYFNAINHSSKSLKYYKDNLLFERAIDSYIVTGMAYKNMKNYVEAEKNYNLAKKLAKDYRLTQYKGMLYQNLGSLQAIQENHEKAIEYYKHSLENKEGPHQVEGYMITTLSIIKEYSKQKDHLRVLSWCEAGLSKLDEIKDNQTMATLSYIHHFHIYKAFHSCSEDFEAIIKKGINYFEKVHDDRHVQKYSILLADYYYRNSRFKAANIFYQKANEILFRQKSISKWEDL